MSRNLIISWLCECPFCGNSTHSVLSAHGFDEYLYDDDHVTCMDCGLEGEVYVDDGFAYVAWSDFNEA